MSNLEKDPQEIVVESGGASSNFSWSAADSGAETRRAAALAEHGLEVLMPRDVPLGGPRAMHVRRTLPQRQRSTIGAWCFVDHYGPEDVSLTGGMRVPPHPHTGLQTVSWLFAGEIEHRDSLGTLAYVRPGEVNLMTAGRGISHSEVSTPATTSLHGVQLWLALPDSSRAIAPAFEHAAPPVVTRGDADVRVFVGTLAGDAVEADQRATVGVHSPLVGAQLDVVGGGEVDLDLDPTFEHGILVDAGPALINGSTVGVGELAYLPVRTSRLVISASEVPARLLLLGGEPLTESILMWWNFIGRTNDEVVAYRDQWQSDVISGDDPNGRFGTVEGYDGSALPAPALPTVRLKTRSQLGPLK